MKKICLLLVAALALASGVQAQVNWKPIVEASTTTPAGDQQFYFVDYSTSWCGWCKKMDKETFSDPVVSAILNRYFIPVHFDAEGNDVFSWNGTKYTGQTQANGRKAPHGFTRAVLGQKIGYPSFAIFGSKQNLVTVLQGYYSAYDFSMMLWYYVSGDNTRYAFESYREIFDKEIKPGMMRTLGLQK